MKISTEHLLWGILRISMGFLFLWPFLDKLLGLGFATEPGKAWINGVSPTYGYLTNATRGPFETLFQAMAGNVIVDWLFMLGLLLIGLSLILGIGVRIAGYSGALMLFLIFLAASLPPEHNPVIDEHIIYALVMLLLTTMPAGEWLGLGKWWRELPFVKERPSLQ